MHHTYDKIFLVIDSNYSGRFVIVDVAGLKPTGSVRFNIPKDRHSKFGNELVHWAVGRLDQFGLPEIVFTSKCVAQTGEMIGQIDIMMPVKWNTSYA
jgi:hypothetical protein